MKSKKTLTVARRIDSKPVLIEPDKGGCARSVRATMGQIDRTSIPEVADSPREADQPHESLIAHFGADRPLKLDAGVELSPFQIAYKTYGTLNAERSNAVLICHALTGDQHVASVHPVTRKSGGWETTRKNAAPLEWGAAKW